MKGKDEHKERWGGGNDRTDRMEQEHIHQAVCVYQQQICCYSYEDQMFSHELMAWFSEV